MSDPEYTAEEFARRESEIVEACKALVGPSLIERFARSRPEAREEFLEGLGSLDAARLLYEWPVWARPKQLAPPGDWTLWLNLGGRGIGKNRSGAEWVRERIEVYGARTIALIAPDWKDLRRFMIGGYHGAGGSGLLDVFPPWNRPVFLEQKAEVHWPNGALAVLQSAEKPEFRGANADTIWWDEICKSRYARELWDNVEMTLREPGLVEPQALITSTPAPIQVLRDLIMDPGTVVTHGTTFENESNVARSWVARMRRRYAGTRVGEQELGARMLVDDPDALFHQAVIDAHRVFEAPELVRIGVGIDPAVSTNRRSDLTGIVAVGVDVARHLFVLADGTGKFTPEAWARRAIDLAVAQGADFFVVERNKIGELAKSNVSIALRSRELLGEFDILEAYSMLDKGARATPVASLYEQGRVHHVGRRLGELEAEMTGWNPKLGRSPNRLDALVHCAFALLDLASEVDVEPDPAELWRGLSTLNRGFRPGGGGRRTV
jgi:phage terminase large subunit-like protein